MARSKDLRERTRYTGATLATQVVTALAALLFLAPLLIILNYSFKTKRELYIGNPLALPESLNLTNYQNAYNKLDLSVTFVNTALYTIVAVAFLALLGSVGAVEQDLVPLLPGAIRMFGFLLIWAGLLAVAGAPTAAAVFQIIQNHTGHTALLLGLLVLPDILVIPAAQADKGTFLQTHFADAVNEGRIEALDGNVDPAVVFLGTGVVDLLAYTETHEVALFRELKGGCVLVAFGDYHIGCKEH